MITDPLGQTIHLSEVAWPLAYRFPVHRIGPDQQPSEPPEQATCLVVYRDMSDTVKFLEISPVTYRLLQILEDEGSVAAAECLKRLATEIGYSSQGLAEHGAEILRALAERGVIGAS